MTTPLYLVSSYHETWLCRNLVPVEILAKFPDDRIARLLANTLLSRPGAQYAYMECCDIDCDVSDGWVVAVRYLAINRPTAKVVLI